MNYDKVPEMSEVSVNPGRNRTRWRAGVAVDLLAPVAR